MASAVQAAKSSISSSSETNHGPLIPLSLIDGPTQRVYLASAFILLETYKVTQTAASIYSSNTSWTLIGSFWLMNLVFVSAASRLRVPRLAFGRARWIMLYTLLSFLDWSACGGWKTMIQAVQFVPVLGWISSYISEAWSGAFDREMSLSEHRVRLKDLIEPKRHIFGQHTIHVLPYSTASLTPISSTSALSSCFCLDTSDPKAELTIPVRFNNTEPHYLSYSITPFEDGAEPSLHNITINKGSLKHIGGASEAKEMTRRREDQLDLELEDADDHHLIQPESSALVRRNGRDVQTRGSSSNRVGQSSQSLPRNVHAASSALVYDLSVKGIGRIRLERVLDKNRYDARISRSEIIVVECPTMKFVTKEGKSMKGFSSHKQDYCPGDEAILDVQVTGLAPLELMYIRRTQSDHGNTRGKQDRSESFTLSHISGNSINPSPIPFEDRLALALNTRQASANTSFEWALSKDITLPVTVELPEAGRFYYELDQVKDACGNALRKASGGKDSLQEELVVHSKQKVSFSSCNQDKPISLLKGGPQKEIVIKRDTVENNDEALEVQIKYQGADKEWQRTLSLTGPRTSFAINESGTYSLENVKSPYCAGEIGTPWMCVAQEIPPPTSSIEFDPIQDQCAGSVGVKALAILSGTPPFKLKYTVQPKGSAMTTHEKTIDRTREEIEFRPTADGQITYSFVGLSDANYRDIKLAGPSFTQVLHPIAKAAFVGSQGSRGPAVTLHSCEGNTTKAEVRLEGVGPFELSFAVRSSGGELAYTRQVRDITKKIHPLLIDVPMTVAERGGMLTVTLTSIKDAKGCERPLTTSDLSIDVRRSKPSIAFVDPRETLLLEGGEAKLPVRLVGEGPWTVRYQRVGKGEPIIHTTFSKSEGNLVVAKPGVYSIIDIQDQHCPGTVLSAKSTHSVSIRPRPTAAFEVDSSSVEVKKGILSRRAVCMGVQDSVRMHLEGHYPIEVAYQHVLPNKEVIKERFTSAQSTASIELFTGSPGLHTYTLNTVADAIYSDHPLDAKSQRKQMSQEVYSLPHVAFTKSTQGSSSSKLTQKPASLCVGESLSGKATAKESESFPPLTLSGKAPYLLEVEIKDGYGNTRKTIKRSGITKQQYNLEIGLDEFVFDKTGRWSVEVVRIEDGNGCYRDLRAGTRLSLGDDDNQAQRQSNSATFNLEVVETANITSVDPRSDYCVGETIEYFLQGSPPWTVVYDFEGVTSQAAVRSSTFARIAERPGKLTVKKVAHQQNKCENNVQHQTGMTKTIHALPSVYVKEGKHYIEDLREGNEAEIVFKLQGEPPFSFSIQRTQAITRFQKPTVLESYTVTGITEKSYHVYTAEEGTWSVTWLKDRYCEVSLEPASTR